MMATSSRWISLFVILTVTTNISGEDCFNFICYYANNCESGLNNVTGDCNSCKEGWSGTKCQKQNVALKKKTFVDVPQASSSNHDIIVDGITKQDKESCIQEYRLNDSIYLDVDFLSSYYIKEVSIFYKEGAVASLRGFSVFIGNKPDVDEGLLCYQHTTEILTDTTTISCNKTGRYLKMKNSRASPPYPADYSVETDLQICEIQAFACARNTFGENCEGLCHCYENDTCDPFTGICPGSDGVKCTQGWVGDSCDQRCENKYGTNCDKQCSQRQCKETSSCNTFDGKCETGCKPGYREIDCVQVCINGYYGDNCNERCDNKGYCNISTDCNHRTGYCNNGCQPGWTGLKCDSVCNTGSFGNNCQQTCHCYGNDVCNHVTGICPGTGRLKCEEGWSGDRCDQDCAVKYGTNCDKQCSQRQCKETSSCNTFDGKCETGCKPGYREIDCVQECSLGNYGEGCSKQCTSNGQYCNEFGCDHITGVCKDGCQSGWLGNSCTEECQFGLYGEKCMFNCSLRNCINMSECNPMDGSCNGNCQDGWSGDDCVQECPINYYGMNCTIRCEERNCKVNSTCNNNDGECVGGCLEGFIGLDCLFIEPSADQVVQDNGLDRLYVGLIGVLCGLIFCIIIVVVIYLVCRNKWRRKLLISERRKTKEAIYDDIPDLPPDIAVNNNLYEEPNTETRSGDHMSNRPLPRIVVDSASGSNLVRNKNNQRESRPYVNQTGHYERLDETNNQPINQAQQSTGPENEETNSQSQPEPSPATQPEPSPATQPAVKRDGSPYITMTRGHQVLPTPNSDNTVNSQHADQTLGAGGYAFGINPQDGDTDSISTVDSCCSDKLQQEKNEVRDAAENVMQRKENEYVKMGDMGKNEAKTNPVSSSGNPGEGHVNRNFSE